MLHKDTGLNEYKLRGKLRMALTWSIVVEVGLIVLLVLFFTANKEFKWILLGAAAAYTILFIYMMTAGRKGILKDMLKFSADYSKVQHKLVKEMNIPYCIMDLNGKVLWMNRQMREITGEDEDFNKNIAAVFKAITPNVFPDGNETKELRFSFNSRYYRAEIKRVSSFTALYLFDETNIHIYKSKLSEDNFTCAIIEIDNYEDVIESVEDLSQTFVAGIVEKKINDYFTKNGAFVKKLEKDRYFAVFRYKELKLFQENRFNILEDVKTVNVGNDMTVTLSIGIGTGGENYNRSYELAKSALELALGRGGDQAVIRECEKVRYYGGRTQQMERNTRVKVRVTAHALRRIFESTGKIVIMGHKLPDIDAFGAEIGMYCFARHLGKEAYIVINDISSSIKPFYDRFIGREDYEAGAFIKSDEAIMKTDANTTVVVVDVNRPDLTDCPEILLRAGNRVVFDHHRTSSEPIKNVVLAYNDSFASSTCEMVTEMMQFGSLDIKLKGFEADAMYAGIVIDTDNFHSKSGPRTFEAAAYLRRNGADVIRVRKLLRSDLSEYKSVADAVSNAELYRGSFAFAFYIEEGAASPTIGCAKAANQLLDIAGIEASFVMTEYNNKLHISARSIDEVNVQIIMEKIGGGGHLNIAAAQLEDTNYEEARELLKRTIDKMLAEGEI